MPCAPSKWENSKHALVPACACILITVPASKPELFHHEAIPDADCMYLQEWSVLACPDTYEETKRDAIAEGCPEFLST